MLSFQLVLAAPQAGELAVEVVPVVSSVVISIVVVPMMMDEIIVVVEVAVRGRH